MLKKITYKVKGMNRDLSESAFNPEFAYEIKNLRVTPDKDNTLLSWCNEKGPRFLEDLVFQGTIIGTAECDEGVVAFVALDNYYNGIVLISVTYNKWKEPQPALTTIYEGLDLGFSEYNPIDTLVSKDTDVTKIYWTDGINQSRMLKVLKDQPNYYTKASQFDFIPTIQATEQVIIEKQYHSAGLFPSGVVQYACSYFEKGGRESRIFYVSPLYYTSPKDRGGSPEDTIHNAFNITLLNLDTTQNFTHIRIYSIIRTSLDATPECKIVAEIPFQNNKKTIRPLRYKYKVPTSRIVLKEAQSPQDIADGNYEYRSLSSLSKDNYQLLLSGATISSGVGFGGPYYTAIFIDADASYFAESPLLAEEGFKGTIIHPKVGSQTTVINIRDGEIYHSDGTGLYVDTLNTVSYTDYNKGINIDPYQLLYVGGEEIFAKTINQKDTTLFLGNITIPNYTVTDEIKTLLKTDNYLYSLMYTSKNLDNIAPRLGYYTYSLNLDKSSYKNKYFQSGVTYHFGVQLQNKQGRWSEPIYLKGVRGGSKPNSSHNNYTFYGENTNIADKATCILSTEVIEKLRQDFIAIRPVISYPELSEREIVCQGVLCPTVYNIGDRKDNSPFVQSSWFARPNVPFDVDYANASIKDLNNVNIDKSKIPIPLDAYTPIDGSTDYLMSKAAIMGSGVGLSIKTDTEGTDLDIVIKLFDVSKYGDWLEFRHNKHLPSSKYRNSEIQSMYLADPEQYANLEEFPPKADDYYDYNYYLVKPDLSSQEEKQEHLYYVDSSIVTFHSPDIEFNENINVQDCKLRIVGMVPLTSCYSDIDIQTSTAPLTLEYDPATVSPGIGKGFVNPITNPVTNDSKYRHYGFRCNVSTIAWLDEVYRAVYSIYDRDKYDFDGYHRNIIGAKYQSDQTAFAVYPWHRNGSLNNQRVNDESTRSSMLDTKKMSNLRFSYNTAYLPTSTDLDICDCQLFTQSDFPLVKLKNPYNTQSINYYANIDKIQVSKVAYPIMIANRVFFPNSDKDYSVKYEDLFKAPFYKTLLEKKYEATDASGEWSNLLYSKAFVDYHKPELYEKKKEGLSDDPISIKYKSTPHAVIVLNKTSDNKQLILPTIYEDLGNSAILNYNGESYEKPFCWNTIYNYTATSQPVIDISPIKGPITDSKAFQFGWLWLGELYRTNTITKLETERQWQLCGDAMSLQQDSITLEWLEGDTYYQRYDHIKTYPYTLEDQNSMTEVVSFMCETTINLDGRYDRNRGSLSNLSITNENFNLINSVYNQNNNFFNFKIEEKLANVIDEKLLKYPTSVVWSLTKGQSEQVDTWTNITAGASLMFDSNLGEITSIQTLNDSLIVFQDKGISQLLYNENAQLTTSQGIPVEIGNSGKVTGKRLISDTIGCKNALSICKTSQGLYFIDDLNRNIYRFNGTFTNLSDTLGMHTWIKSCNFDADNKVSRRYRTYYDKLHGEVLFSSNDTLAYSELLNTFTSFYDYNYISLLSSIKDTYFMVQDYSLNNNKLSIFNEGEYNRLNPGPYNSYSITLLANPDPTVDKIFNTVEYRADVIGQPNASFSNLTVWNEYQRGEAELKFTEGISNLQKKFRIWRANIPRDKYSKYKRDRIRNPWAYIKLSHEINNTFQMKLHDIVVHYSE